MYREPQKNKPVDYLSEEDNDENLFDPTSSPYVDFSEPSNLSQDRDTAIAAKIARRNQIRTLVSSLTDGSKTEKGYVKPKGLVKRVSCAVSNFLHILIVPLLDLYPFLTIRGPTRHLLL